ncbi:MAG: sialate O-acetylesterase [Methanococcaceae archaeon]
MKKLLLLLMVTIFLGRINAQSFIELPAIFSDNMVLQQKSLVPVWGKGPAGSAVTVKASWGASASAIVEKEGLWKLRIKTPKAGGPYELNITIGDTSIIYKNVLLGEVWLCSGQSNMEMPLGGWPPKDTIWTAPQEIKTAANTGIRFFTVSKMVSDTKQFNCKGKWVECSSEEAARFSATAYFFGKKLNKDLNVPIGLINTSWGGTPIESWISGSSLSEITEFKPVVDNISQCREETIKLNNWLTGHAVIDVKNADVPNRWKALDFQDSLCSHKDFNDAKWPEMELPVVWETTFLGNFDGAGWFRKKIELPQSWLNKDLVLELGPIDDMDETYVNGIKAGEHMEDGNWQVDRVYNIPATLVKDSVLFIAVRIVDNQGGGGIYGKPEQMNIHLKDGSAKINIAGAWTFLPVAELRDMKFFVFGSKNEEYFSRPKLKVDLSAYMPTALYNAMISPLIPYSIKGAIWYQGESNAGAPEMYRKLFPLMINNWRQDWHSGEFPFYFVQIAPYNYGPATPSEKLREAQMMTLSVAKTGMAVTMDIGNVNNIHPGNKRAVGERLALWALAKDYNKKAAYSGPVYKAMKVIKDKIVISFDHADGGLKVEERNGENNFLIAGKDGKFVKAIVKVEGKKLIVSSPGISDPAFVRYAWSNTAEATLYNKKGLPASSFRTDSLEAKLTL